jgi:hypothetical protein
MVTSLVLTDAGRCSRSSCPENALNGRPAVVAANVTMLAAMGLQSLLRLSIRPCNIRHGSGQWLG